MGRRANIAALSACALVVMAGAGAAQEADTPEQVPLDTAWTVFVQQDPLRCWLVSQPVDVVNTREGQEVDVNRGDTAAFVSYWPEQNRVGEVSFTGGYPFDEGSVSIEIDGMTFDMFTEGEMAWALSEAADAEIIDAFRDGQSMSILGRSTRGTNTRDTFSLNGFASAVADAEERCVP